MRLSLVLAAAAYVGIFIGAQARAIPFCEAFPESPICNPEEPPIDPCELDPASCEPDPCELDPASCEPDPCELDPGSCEPDPCEADPASCEPLPEQETYTQVIKLKGSSVLKGEGFKERAEADATFDFNSSDFLLVFNKDAVFKGGLSPKGKKGKKFQLFLDDESRVAFAIYVGELAGIASGRAAIHTLGESSKFILQLRENGTGVLKIKSQVLDRSDDSEIVFKLNASGLVEEPLPPS
jgi:hypothetical protein